MGETISINSEDPLSTKNKRKINKEGKKNLVLLLLIAILVGAYFVCFGGNKTVSGKQADLDGQVSSEEILSGDLASNELSEDEKAKKELEDELYEMVGDYPVKEMIPYISKYDRKVAGLIVGIAKKESNWGKHSPSKNGNTCYNYWGYKGGGSLGHSLGYGCFATPEEGVDAIGGRIQELVEQELDTPSKMIVWKCGSTCAGHDPQGVSKWISDVSIYYNQIVSG